MRRREFIAMLAGGVAWPLASLAQERGRTYRLGFLLPTPRKSPAVAAFFDELRLNGFVEGDNLTIIPGFEATDERLAEQALALANAAKLKLLGGHPHPPNPNGRSVRCASGTISIRISWRLPVFSRKSGVVPASSRRPLAK